jgi:6-phosphogluconolactonase
MVFFYPPEMAGQGARGDVPVPDLGTDAVLTYALGTDGKLVEKEELRFSTAPGAGPRHLRVHPNGRPLFVLDELGSTVMVLRLDGRSLAPVSTVSTLGTGSFPEGAASE